MQNGSWREIYNAQRAFLGEPEPVKRTPRLGWVDTPLKQHASRNKRVLIYCGVCFHSNKYSIPHLLSLLGPEATAYDIESRMICPVCKHEGRGNKVRCGGLRWISVADENLKR